MASTSVPGMRGWGNCIYSARRPWIIPISLGRSAGAFFCGKPGIFAHLWAMQCEQYAHRGDTPHEKLTRLCLNEGSVC